MDEIGYFVCFLLMLLSVVSAAKFQSNGFLIPDTRCSIATRSAAAIVTEPLSWSSCAVIEVYSVASCPCLWFHVISLFKKELTSVLYKITPWNRRFIVSRRAHTNYSFIVK